MVTFFVRSFNKLGPTLFKSRLFCPSLKGVIVVELIFVGAFVTLAPYASYYIPMRSGWKLPYGAGLIKRAGIYAAQTIPVFNLFLPEGRYKPPREGSMARVPLVAPIALECPLNQVVK